MESTNKNVRFVLNLGDCDVFIFNPLDCLWDNYLMGTITRNEVVVQEYCVTIINPVGKDIELFCKEGDVVCIQTFVRNDGNIVAKTAVSLPRLVATNFIYGYDELLEENVSLDSCFTTEVEDEEPSVADIMRIEEEEIEELIRKSKTLTIEDLLEYED